MNSVDPGEIQMIEKMPTDKFKLFYHGTINHNLNLSSVIEALNILKTKYPEEYKNIEFNLYGEGPDLKNILDLAKEYYVENVKYHGSLKYSDMYKELANASAIVIPPKKDIYSDLYYSGKIVESIYMRILLTL